jgi:hypothetical protein
MRENTRDGMRENTRDGMREGAREGMRELYNPSMQLFIPESAIDHKCVP